MKKLFFGAAAMLALASCSSENTLEVNNGNEIAFTVATNNTSRAADVYCNNNKPGEFNVWASHDSKQYIAGDLIKFEGGKWVNKSGNRYWPSTGDVTFVAYENENGTFAFNPTGASNLTNFTVPTDVANQLDFIYARKTQAKATPIAPVALNFRHALSQIVYKAKNTNKNLYVEIGAVSIVNVNSKADFAFPTADTTTPYVDHGSTGDATIENQGVWSNWSTLATFPVSFGNKEVEGNSTAVDLTAANDPSKEFSSKALLLLPQTTTAWAPGTITKPTDATNTNTYFVLSCKIRNVRGASVDDYDVYLYGSSSDYASIYIPVAVNWEQGKKYVYTFTFGDGTAGYDHNGDHVLVPITFDVTVDDFKLGDEHDVNMD